MYSYNLDTLNLTDMKTMTGGHGTTFCEMVCNYVDKQTCADDVIKILTGLDKNHPEFDNFMTKKIDNYEGSPFVKLFNFENKNFAVDSALTKFIENTLLDNNTQKYTVTVGNDSWVLEPIKKNVNENERNEITDTVKMKEEFDNLGERLFKRLKPKDLYSFQKSETQTQDTQTPQVQNEQNEEIIKGGGMTSNTNFSTLNNIINKLQQFSVLQDGGKSKSKSISKSKSKKVSGSRKLHAHTEEGESSGGDSDTSKKSKKSKKNKDDSKNLKNIGSAMSLMMNSRRDQLFDQFKNTILGMLEKKIIQIKNKVIDATEENASIIKSYLYRLVRDKNPTMSSFDKITILNKKSESEILEDLKDIPTIPELKKQMEEFKEAKQKEKEMNSDESGLTELPKQKTKKESKKSKGSKSSKKSSKKTKN
jgi:hypothetical protein